MKTKNEVRKELAREIGERKWEMSVKKYRREKKKLVRKRGGKREPSPSHQKYSRKRARQERKCQRKGKLVKEKKERNL